MGKSKQAPIFKLLYQDVDLSRFSLRGPEKVSIENPKSKDPELTVWQTFNSYQDSLSSLKEKERNVKTFLEVKKAVVLEKKNYDKTYGSDYSGSFEEEVEEAFRGLVHKIDQYMEKAILDQILLMNKKVQFHSRTCKVKAFDNWKGIRKDFDKKLNQRVKLLEKTLNKHLDTAEIRGLKGAIDKKSRVGVGDFFYFFCRQMGESLSSGDELVKKFKKKVDKTFLKKKEIELMHHKLRSWREKLDVEEDKMRERLFQVSHICENRASYFAHLISNLEGKFKFQKVEGLLEEIRVLASEREAVAVEAMKKVFNYFKEAKEELVKALDEILTCFEGKQKLRYGYVH